MRVRRRGAGVGVLDGVIYAVGGFSGTGYLKSVEAFSPSVGVWTPVADMHMCRSDAGNYIFYLRTINVFRKKYYIFDCV